MNEEKTINCFRPLIRGFFFYNKPCNSNNQFDNSVSVPSFGDSFFIMYRNYDKFPYDDHVSVPSFGDSFFIAERRHMNEEKTINCFRPLIRGFFFYKVKNYIDYRSLGGFRPLIRGFFFYLKK